MEADRLMNSFVRAEDLASEMTVVRNEFESGENNPQRVLRQRMQSTAYDWHNYGRTTIGNRSDIERVPIDRLKAFYRKFYRPDNVMVVIAGKFQPDEALSLVEKYFGALEAPPVPLDRTYTTEPAQDGERTVVLRRVGNVQHVGVQYHVPAAATREYAAMDMIASIYGTEPSGRLYQDLVVPEIASSVVAGSFALHDPGNIMFSATVPVEKSIESARQTLIQTVEGIAQKPVTTEELKRAQTQFTTSRERRAANSGAIAIELSEWAAQGDWRLYFLFRDYVESLTPEECTAAARKYLTRNNRTVGLFIPTEEAERVEIEAKPDLEELLADYKGREQIQAGEAFDPSPMAVEARTTRGKLKCGLDTAFLPKQTRGKTVSMRVSLRYGNEKSLQPYRDAIQFLPQMLMRGTKELDYQDLQDKLDELGSRVSPTGANGLLTVGIQTTREKLSELIPLVGEILREPRFDEEELEIMKRTSITGAESSLTEPQPLAIIAYQRALSPYGEEDIRYVPTIEEGIELLRTVSIDQLKDLHATQLNSQHGQIVAVGDFDPEEVAKLWDEALAGWTSDVEHTRIDTPAYMEAKGGMEIIETPDKANAVYYGGTQFKMRDDHPDYPALMVGNFVMGGGAMSSRVGVRVRQKEGLSYTVGSGLSSHPIDERTSLTLYAILNPENKSRLVAVMKDEISTLLKEGITEQELKDAKQSILQRSQVERTQDPTLTDILLGTIFAERDMSHFATMEQKISKLTVEEVNAALREYIKPEDFVIFMAGDFAAC